MTRIKIAAAFIAILLASLACSPAVLLPAVTSTELAPPPATLPAAAAAPQPTLGIPSSLPIQQGDLASLYAALSPGIVNILTFPANAPSGSLPLGQGSGFVIDLDGHIVTNHHVVADAGDIEIDFASGQKAWAELIGMDPDSDLAVLKVDLPAEDLVPLPLGDSDQVRVGQFVVAIGNPFGLSGTMTVGIVSALGRTLDSEREAPTGGAFTAGDIIQTDAAINPGNSGGPLLNLAGEVIGVNRAIRTETTNAEGAPLNAGVGFAIPVNIVRRVAPALIETGNYDYPFLGVSSLNESAWNLRTLAVLGLPDDAVGAYVTCVTPGGPAEQAGVQGAAGCDELGLRAGGDLIVAINGEPVYEFSDLLSYLVNHTRPGDVVTLTVLRSGDEMQIDVTLAGRG